MPPAPSAPEGSYSSEAASLFARHLAERQAGAGADLEALCALHPEHAARLRVLDAALALAEGGLTPGAGGRPVDPSEVGTPSAERVELAGRLGVPASARYRIGPEVARGGQGAILRVWDEDLRRPLAMKVLRAALPTSGAAQGSDSRSTTRFLEEARVTGQLDHPGIVPVHELGLDAHGHLFFTMKLVEGEDLKAVFGHVHAGREGWTQTRALGVLLRACEALAFAHARGVIHRDLKPANVMVGRFGEVYVMDWGLARGARDGAESGPTAGREPSPEELPGVTRDGDVIGTPAYMSPEQACGENARVGPRTDVYAVGAMLYQLLAGHAPYLEPGRPRDVVALLHRLRTGPPSPITARAPEAPPELASICERAMARDPIGRYRDVSELGEDLRAYLEDRVVRAHETGAVAELRKWVRRNRALAAALALAVVGLAGIGVSEARGRRAAEAQRERAESAREDVLKLSARRELDDLRRLAQALWPAVPARIPAYEDWIRRADALVASLPEHEARLARLRTRARSRPREELEREWSADSRADEWRALGARLAAERARLEVRRGAPLDLPDLDRSALPEDSATLNAHAWPLVAPDRSAFGREREGLVLAREAHALAASEVELAEASDTLAWASLACGLAEEARSASDEALASAPAARQGEFTGYRERIVAALLALEDEEAEIERLGARLVALEDELGGDRWVFDDPSDRWWHAELAGLVDSLRTFARDRSAELTPALGWSVERRLTFARTIEARSRTDESARTRWADASRAIADRAQAPRYGGLRLPAQLGLLPLGPDPESGLWEFAHLASGEPPERGPDGRLRLADASAIVLVLVPGGEASIGAQRADRSASHFDPDAQRHEAPVHVVELAPFFLAKHEMTQGQWERFTGVDPAYYQAARPSPSLRETPTALHPVEQVSWDDCVVVLGRLGLELPTEAQWEYACRAGTDTPWWTGATRETLSGAANLADRTWAAAVASTSSAWAEFDDGHAVHAPVDALRPNGFGLLGVLGNVWEWCRDTYDAGAYGHSPRADPLATVPGARFRVARGGSFVDGPDVARCAYRLDAPREYRHHSLGVRPARALDP